jgi:DNA-binding MarR family transcriptional regulator
MVQATLGITPGRPPVHAQHGLSIALRRPSANAEHRLRMTAIAWRVLLSRSRSTRLVDRLVELGWAARCIVDNAGRGLFAQLTTRIRDGRACD